MTRRYFFQAFVAVKLRYGVPKKRHNLYNSRIVNFIKKFFSNAKEGLLVLFYAFKDKRTPALAKILTFFAAVYLISPVDALPDTFFPFGFLDDLAIVPALFYFVYKSLPAEVLAQAREKSHRTNKTINRSIIALFCSAAAAALLFLILLYLLYKLLFG
jgi:uncharacterized membrane protein YkvA (DUF1232 family)